MFDSNSELENLSDNVIQKDKHIIIFINCNWVITRWQWLYYMYTNMGEKKKKVTRKFKSGGLHERHVVAIWKHGNHLSIRL